jgi:hypothetical protein
MIKFRTGDDRQIAHQSWYRGQTRHFNPTKSALRSEAGLHEFLLRGWLPPAPFIGRGMRIATIGSCFAGSIAKWLMRRQYETVERSILLRGGTLDDNNSHVIRLGEGAANTFVLRSHFEWLFESHASLPPPSDGALAADEHLRLVVSNADVFIVTLGLAEVCYLRSTQAVLARPVPRRSFDPHTHGFRVTTVEENRDNLEAIYGRIRRMRPGATIILTLSPIPLVATFRPTSAVTANAVSKSILRVAVDELMRSHANDPRLFYWPSYEIVKEYCIDPYEEDNRHPKPHVIDLIMHAFASAYLSDPPGDEELDALESRATSVFRQQGLTSTAIARLLEFGVFDGGSSPQALSERLSLWNKVFWSDRSGYASGDAGHVT